MITAGKISKITGVSRATVYRYLQLLTKEGLVSQRIEDGVAVYPDYAVDLVKRLYELVKITGQLEDALKALKTGETPARTDVTSALWRLNERMDRLEKLLEGFISSVSRRLDEIERRLSELEGPKGLPAPETGKKKPWWSSLRFFGKRWFTSQGKSSAKSEKSEE
jgi:DNA-binding transcriptional ArsR family regulator